MQASAEHSGLAQGRVIGYLRDPTCLRLLVRRADLGFAPDAAHMEHDAVAGDMQLLGTRLDFDGFGRVCRRLRLRPLLLHLGACG